MNLLSSDQGAVILHNERICHGDNITHDLLAYKAQGLDELTEIEVILEIFGGESKTFESRQPREIWEAFRPACSRLTWVIVRMMCPHGKDAHRAADQGITL